MDCKKASTRHGTKALFLWEKVVPGKKVTFGERLYENKDDPFARVSSKKAWPLYEEAPARWVILPTETTFCFSCKLFVKFCKEMKEKLDRPGQVFSINTEATASIRVNGPFSIY